MTNRTQHLHRLTIWLSGMAATLLASLVLISAVAAQGNSPQAVTGTAFTYQGRLTDNGQPATGLYDLQFALFDAGSGGAQVGSTLTKNDLQVTAGLFNVDLDFGNVFDGKALFLEISVRPGNSTGSYTTLSPRVSLTAVPYAMYSLNNWGLNGNSGLSANNYLGTKGNLTLTLGVSGTAALRIVPATVLGHGLAPNLIGGSNANFIGSATIAGTTIAGGGVAGFPNYVNADYAVVGGGVANGSIGFAATVGGGSENSAFGYISTIGGGVGNQSGGVHSTVGGGYHNAAVSQQATVGGGANNTANNYESTVSGGQSNTASGYQATVSGGTSNIASGQNATVTGGNSNFATGDYAIAGGRNNVASGQYSTVPGGSFNTAQGDYSLAAGKNAKANHAGSFVWGDSTNSGDITSSAPDQFIARASGGVFLYTGGGLSTGCTLAAGSGSWSCTSDRNAKANFTPVDAREVLNRLAHIPISTWNYKTQDSSIRHVGPMAQDFSAAFGVGEDVRHISMVDADGVALASIQGLNQIVEDEIASRDGQIAQLQARLDVLENHAGSVAAENGTSNTWIWLMVGVLLGSGAFWLGSRRARGGIR